MAEALFNPFTSAWRSRIQTFKWIWSFPGRALRRFRALDDVLTERQRVSDAILKLDTRAEGISAELSFTYYDMVRSLEEQQASIGTRLGTIESAMALSLEEQQAAIGTRLGAIDRAMARSLDELHASI